MGPHLFSIVFKQFRDKPVRNKTRSDSKDSQHVLNVLCVVVVVMCILMITLYQKNKSLAIHSFWEKWSCPKCW